MDKEKFQREYLINASKGILYNCLSTPSGLSEWFADDVNIRKDVYTFLWDGAGEDARLLTKKREEYVKFKWLETEEDDDDKSFFELRIKIDALTGETALIVTDFAEEDELEEAQLLWDSQVDKLKRILGS
ncbi:START-like domain-containing protein [Sanyastnella coralliicola]|uniref:START-like domain-containing protein n=1 Tax=Sanyastnella coralliicola TaxID=3069118 RepID=UPI0027BA27C2|nr:START-like domain-containing protein [Longitalea sp. SCSIO 12813]